VATLAVAAQVAVRAGEGATELVPDERTLDAAGVAENPGTDDMAIVVALRNTARQAHMGRSWRLAAVVRVR
jgi:hypothetical protein